jgi:hypothetical protein
VYDYCVKDNMQFIQGNNRHQTYFSTLEDQVSADNAVRLIDAFIDKLELQQLGFNGTVHKSEGRPPYAPAVLLKLDLRRCWPCKSNTFTHLKNAPVVLPSQPAKGGD